jgi:hypothetical protein
MSDNISLNLYSFDAFMVFCSRLSICSTENTYVFSQNKAYKPSDGNIIDVSVKRFWFLLTTFYCPIFFNLVLPYSSGFSVSPCL